MLKEASMPQTMNLTKILDTIHENTDGERISVGDIIDALDHRGFGPLMLASGLFALPPIGSIPGFPVISGVLISLFAIQIIVGRRTPWVPQRIRKWSIKRDKFEEARCKIGPRARKFDGLLRTRLTWFSSGIMIRLAALMCIPMSILLVPLEFIPFGATVPEAALLLFALGISARDGLMIILGFLVSFASFGMAVYLLM